MLFKQTEQDLNIIFVNVIDFIVIREIINETDMNMGSQIEKTFQDVIYRAGYNTL